jgi:hypothetical protein
MSVFYKIKINNLESIQSNTLSKIPLQDLKLTPTRLFYPEYNFLDDRDLLCELDEYGLTNYIYGVAIFVLGPNMASPIHIDGDLDYTWSLNIPLTNCENTRTSFYQSNQTPTRKKSPNSNIEYSVFSPELCSLLASVELNDAYLMNVSVPHRIYNPNPTQRTSICIRLKSTFDIDTILERLHMKEGG